MQSQHTVKLQTQDQKVNTHVGEVNENSRSFRFLEFLIANQFRDKPFSGGKLILTDTIFRDVISMFKTSISKDASDQQIKELKIKKKK